MPRKSKYGNFQKEMVKACDFDVSLVGHAGWISVSQSAVHNACERLRKVGKTRKSGARQDGS